MIGEELIMGGIEINVSASENVQTARKLTGAEFDVSLSDNEVSLYANGGI